MGRNRKPRNAIGSAFEYGDSGFVTSDGRLVREERLAANTTAAQLADRLFAESPATENQVVNGIGPINLRQGGVWRTVPDGALRRAWERTDAATLARALPVDSSSYDERLPALLNAFDLPTPREFFDMERPRRPKLAKKDVEDFATTLNGMLSAFRDGGQANWRSMREIMTDVMDGGRADGRETRGGPGLRGFDLMPSTLDQRFRTASDATKTFGRVTQVAKDIAARTDIPEIRRLQAILMADAIGGYHLIRERLYETMILSGGSESPKGQHLAKAVKAINVEVRRLSRQINVVMREQTASSTPSAATGLPPLQANGTIGRSIYRTLYTEPGDNAFARSGIIIQGLIRAGKWREMESINNN